MGTLAGEWVPGMWYLDKKEENGGAVKRMKICLRYHSHRKVLFCQAFWLKVGLFDYLIG